MKFFESVESKQVSLRLISKTQLTIIGKVKQFIREYVDLFGSDSKTKSVDRKKFEEFVSDNSSLRKIKAFDQIFKSFDDAINEFKLRDESKLKSSEALNQLVSKSEQLKKAFQKKDIESILRIGKELSSPLSTLRSANQSSTETDKNTNKMVKSDASFFNGGRESILDSFKEDEIKRVINLDLEKFKYSFLEFSGSIVDDFDYLIRYILELRDDPKPIRLGKSEFRLWNKFLRKNDDQYKDLLDLVAKYLFDNSKEDAKKIISMMSKYPELVELNDREKARIKTVYRGIGTNEPLSTQEILAKEKEFGFVATSKSMTVASNFAHGRGHLEDANISRSNHKYIITYQVDKSSIILVTSIFGSVYGEDEILIDPNKVKSASVKG